jgi:predicted O-methyltransferase YrrM
MNQWEGRRLHLVDLWGSDPRNRDRSQVDTALHQARRQTAEQRLSRFGDRVHFHQADSLMTARQFADNSLDFVYLDADHSVESVQEDIAAWFPKIRSGGLLAGHDFLDGKTAECEFGVQTAVQNWEAQSGYRAASTAELSFASWYAFKQ